MKNLENFITNNLNLNLAICNFFFYRTRFESEDLEERYQKQEGTDNQSHILLGEIMINLGYFASIIYVIFAYYKLIFLLIILIFWFISLILIYISHKQTDNQTRLKINYLLVFLISFVLNLKAILLSTLFKNELNKRYGELLRVIIYDFVSSNLFTVIIDEANLKVHVFYFFFNAMSILFAEFNTETEYFFYLEIFTSFCFSFIFYFFRKAWDYKLRSIYAEKFKMEKYFLYSKDFINGLDAYHLNFKNKNLMFLNEKFIRLLGEEILNEKPEVDEEKVFYSKNQIDIEEYFSSPCNSERSHIKRISVDSGSKLKDNQIVDSESNLNERNEISPSVFNFNENESKGNSRVFGMNSARNESENAIAVDNERERILKSNRKEDYLDVANEFIRNLFPYDLKMSVNNNDIKNSNNESERELKINFKENENLEEKNLEYFLENYLSDMENEEKKDEKNKFHSYLIRFGIFKTNISSLKKKNYQIKEKENDSQTKYFDIVIRRTEIETKNFVYDILFFDVTKIMLSKIKISEENSKREKILAKMAHEFKTPINSIVGLIGLIKENLLSKTKNSESTLNLIENLSKYVLFLISDIIHYLNPEKNHDVKIQKDNVKLKESLNFCYEIMKSLISCNKIKMENVTTELFIESSLNEITLYTDEQRFKQILLNLISNSVKFTTFGKITISAEYNQRKSELVIKVADTGIGIKNESKEKLFKEYSKLDEGISINKLGDGLGLSICKYLAKKLDIKIKYKSEFGQGSTFYLIFDFSIREKLENKIRSEFNFDAFGNIEQRNKNKNIEKDKVSKFKKSNHSSDSYSSNEIKDDYPNQSRRIKSLNMLEDENSFFFEENFNNNNNNVSNYSVNNKNSPREEKNTVELYNLRSNKNPFTNEIDEESKKFNDSDLIEIIENVSENNNNFNELNQENQNQSERNESILPSNKSYSQEIIEDVNTSLITEKKIILIVDDNSIINESLKRLLEAVLKAENADSLYEIVVASDGLDILINVMSDKNLKGNLKLVFTDENMDFLSGSDAIRLVRLYEKREKVDKVSIISITCHEDPKIVGAIMSKGADLVLSKPISKSLIRTTLKQFDLI